MFVLLRHLAKVRRSAALERGAPRSVAIRHVDAGSCNGCEHELGAATNPYYDLQRLGLSLTASPRHADVLLVTGPVTTRMRDALLIAYHAMPEHAWSRHWETARSGVESWVTPTSCRDPWRKSSRSPSASRMPPTPEAIAAHLIAGLDATRRARNAPVPG